MGIHQIVSRTYIFLKLSLISPLSVSNGESINTDSDVMKNGNGEYFTPGSSFAGAFRAYSGKKKSEDSIYGYLDKKMGRMSSIYISDLYFVGGNKNVTNSIRDRVALDSTKGVENKFDMEIIEPGISGEMHFEIIRREGDVYDFDKAAVMIIQGIQSGEIRIGANKNRGFGRLAIDEIREISFDKTKRKEWIDFCARGYVDDTSSDGQKYADWIAKKNTNEKKYASISIPLLLKDGISIRKYSAWPGKADFEHITCNGKPVVPGTSWNGAIRHEAKRVLRLVGCDEKKVNQLIDYWFGYVNKDKSQDKACQSIFVISESIIENAKAVPISRNRINRFTNGTIDGALFSEVSFFGGTTTLECMIRKDDQKNYKAFIGLLELVISNILNGYVPVGGQVSIGRGVFCTNSEEPFERYVDGADISECRTEFYGVIKGGQL